MRVNDEYFIAKGLVADYIKSMDKVVEDNKRLMQLYDDDVQTDELEYFDYNKALKFNRLWDVIKHDLPPTKRNLLLCFEACGEDYTKCLAFFNGNGMNYKNKATLHVLVCNARNMANKLYTEKYDSN